MSLKTPSPSKNLNDTRDLMTLTTHALAKKPRYNYHNHHFHYRLNRPVPDIRRHILRAGQENLFPSAGRKNSLGRK